MQGTNPMLTSMNGHFRFRRVYHVRLLAHLILYLHLFLHITNIMSGQFVELGGLRVDISQFDLSDTRSRVNDVRTANIVLISLVIVVVSLRLFARIRFVKRIFADDSKYLRPLLYTFTYTYDSSDCTCCGVYLSFCINKHCR
jgi:hypothetical protein